MERKHLNCGGGVYRRPFLFDSEIVRGKNETMIVEEQTLAVLQGIWATHITAVTKWCENVTEYQHTIMRYLYYFTLIILLCKNRALRHTFVTFSSVVLSFHLIYNHTHLKMLLISQSKCPNYCGNKKNNHSYCC